MSAAEFYPPLTGEFAVKYIEHNFAVTYSLTDGYALFKDGSWRAIGKSPNGTHDVFHSTFVKMNLLDFCSPP